MAWRYYRSYYEPPKPKKAKGGIKAGSRRGGIGRSWWAKRWMAVLEGFGMGARLSRGRSYARSGQVVSLDIEKGLVKARVQGTRRSPYKVEITIRTLSDRQWEQLAKAFRFRPIYAAKLLAGEMPLEIEEVFKEIGLSLFPSEEEDLVTDCSCPDWANPCKHIAAVYILLGEEFDRDPFLIFALRGMTRDELIYTLGGGTASNQSKIEGVCEEEQAYRAASPLPSHPSGFWAKTEQPADLLGELTIPRTNAALPKRLGHFPFWRGETPLLSSLETIYSRASRRCLEDFLAKFFD